MKNIVLSIALIAFGALQIKAEEKGKNELKVNTEVSSVKWVGKKVAGEHSGTVQIKDGFLTTKKGKVNGGEITIDMSTIIVTDMEGEWKQKLEGHLNSPDFFDVANHKEATLKIKKVDGEKITGDLTIKGITKEISFQSSIKLDSGKLVAVADIKIDRTEFDIKYGSGKFFEGLGDKMIDDEFVLTIKLAANS